MNYTPTEDARGLPRSGSGDGAGVDLLEGASEAFIDCPPVRPRMANDPTRLRKGVGVEESGVGVGARFHGIFCESHPLQVRAAVCRSRSSRLRSNAARYRSYASRKVRSTRDEKMSSPRGFVVGGIDGIGTADDDRRPNCVGEGDLGRLCDADAKEGRGKR
jgi:hypothetical protein